VFVCFMPHIPRTVQARPEWMSVFKMDVSVQGSKSHPDPSFFKALVGAVQLLM